MNAFTRQLLESRGFFQQPDGAFSKGRPALLVVKKAPKPKPVPAEKSPMAVKFEAAWAQIGGPTLTPELMFHPTRKWRFDYCHPASKIAIELDGGVYRGKKGRHTSPKGFINDCEKLNAAAALGYRVFRLATGMVKPESVKAILACIESNESEP